MLVMGIESSCDDTAIAIMKDDGSVLAHQRASQLDMHQPFGGVVPEIAARAHLQALPYLTNAALHEAGITMQALDAIAATTGPGLIGGVMVGAMAGKAMALSHQIPFIPVNHLQGHALVVRAHEAVAFPYMLLLVSGGHCQILWVKNVGDYELLGKTRDDALGEAFDKCAKLLGLPYPGGPEIEACAQLGDAQAIAFPRPMLGADHADFSFSGLKTAVRLHVESITQHAPLTKDAINAISASFQQAAIDVLEDRLTKALRHISPPYAEARLVVAGGVAANKTIRQALDDFCSTHAMQLHVAPISLCTDNGVMIAWAGIEQLRTGDTGDLKSDVRARWPLNELQEKKPA